MEQEGFRDAPDRELERLAKALGMALSGLTIQLDGEAVGRLVSPTVDSELGRAAYNRRYDR